VLALRPVWEESSTVPEVRALHLRCEDVQHCNVVVCAYVFVFFNSTSVQM
jgi:hypothetical protein